MAIYAKIINNKVVVYPYDYNSLMGENSSVDFQGDYTLLSWFNQTDDAASGATLEEVIVSGAPAYDPLTEYVSAPRFTPELIGGAWLLVKKVYPFSAEDLAKRSTAATLVKT